MGLGHLTRSLSLAAALREAGAQVQLVARDLGLNIASLIRGADVEYIVLPTPHAAIAATDGVPHAGWAKVDWSVDAQQTAEALRAWRPDWLVVDHYAFDARWHRHVRAALGVRIAAVDDLADRDLDAELLVDHNYHSNHFEKYRGRVPKSCRFMTGPRYALLGLTYAARRKFTVRDRVESIGIFMGGTDVANLSETMLRASREHAGFSGRIEVVATQSYPHVARLKELSTRWPNTHLMFDLPDLAEFFARNDLQIGAGGGATWERCCVGAPTMIAIVAANQQAVLPALAELGVAEIIEASALGDAAIGNVIKKLIADPQRRRSLSERSQALVDGLGARRVALRLTAMRLSVRIAEQKDADMMYRWRNHPATRGVSWDSREIAWPDHLEWLSKGLTNSNRCLLIGSVGAVDVGVIRFDRVQPNEWEVSLYLDPDLHGLGLGKALLLAGEARLCASRNDTCRFVATILESNEGSKHLFESSGYRFAGGMWRKPSDCISD